MTALCSLKDVSKVYGTLVKTTALDAVNLDIERGELVVVFGPSGSGKSTLLNLIGALDQPSSGTVSVDGIATGKLSPTALADFRRDKIGFVFQFFNLVPSLTARENVELSAELTHHPERVDDCLAAVGLSHRASHFPAQMSGGEQQRVAIARALVKDPPLLLCDEPTGALDVETGEQVVALLQRLVRDNNRTVVMVTHNPAMEKVADRILQIRDGHLVSDTRRGR